MLSKSFWDRVDKSGDCWLWTGHVQVRGYGIAGKRYGTRLAHRIMYEDIHGPIPEGMVIDHLCHTRDTNCTLNKQCQHRRCVNPDHLEMVSFQVNVSRGRTATKTHCKHGHEFTPENTYLTHDKRGYVGRMCKTCAAEASRRRVARLREERSTPRVP